MTLQPIITRTRTGVEVTLTPTVRAAGDGPPAAKVVASLTHPQLGPITMPYATWCQADGGFVSDVIGGRQVKVGIPKADYDRAICAAEADKTYRDAMAAYLLRSFFGADTRAQESAYAAALALAEQTGRPARVASEPDGDWAEGHVSRVAYVAVDGTVSVARERE